MSARLPTLPTFAPPYPIASRTFLIPANPLRQTHPPPPHAHPFLTRAQLPPTPPPPSTEPPDDDNRDLLERLGQVPDSQPPRNPRSERIAQTEGRLSAAFQYLTKDLSSDFENRLAEPSTLIFSAIIALLFGFVAATSATTIIGSVADWDPLAAAVLLVWTEGFTKFYYKRKNKTKLLQLINAFKIGLIYGMTLDAFKLST